ERIIERVGVRWVPVSSHALQIVRGGRRKIWTDGGPGRKGPICGVGESAKKSSGGETKGTSQRQKSITAAQSRARVRRGSGGVQVRIATELFHETSTL